MHQEDICQALGILPYVKYERAGGPTIAACLELLQKHARTPARDQHIFLPRIVFNFLIGNADAHGKNFATLRHELAQRMLSESAQLKVELENTGITSPVFAQICEVIAQRGEFLRR